MRSKKYIKFNLTDLPTNNFALLLNPKIQRMLIENSAKKISEQAWGKYKKLAQTLHQKCKSLENINLSSLQDNYIADWKNNKKYIPIDCVLELCKLSNTKLKEKDILLIKYKSCHNKNGAKFPFTYDEGLAFLGEAIRTEGHIRKDLKQINISNKNLDFLKKIEKNLKKYIPKKSIYKNISIELDIPKNKKVLEVKTNQQKINFRIYKASKSNKLKLAFYVTPNKLRKSYQIKLSDNSEININIKKIDGELISESDYKVASTVLNLTVCNKTFTLLLHHLLKIPQGKKSDIIFIPDCLKYSPDNVKIEAINAILDAESWISNPIEKRVGIGLNSKKYLTELKNLFNSIGINAYNQEKSSYVYITGIKDLKALLKLTTLTYKRKNKRLIRIIESYKREVQKRNEGLYNLLNYLRLNNKTNTYILANVYNKHQDTIRFHINKGINKGLIEKDINSWPYKYSLTQKGLNFLGDNK